MPKSTVNCIIVSSRNMPAFRIVTIWKFIKSYKSLPVIKAGIAWINTNTITSPDRYSSTCLQANISIYIGGYNSNNIIANIMLAMCLAFIIRFRLDYINHQIAASIVIISFLFTAILSPILFLSFYAIFLIFGSLRDYVGDRIKKKNKLQSLYDNVMWYYPIPALIYCLFYGNWILFWAMLVYTIGFDGIKYIFKKKGYD